MNIQSGFALQRSDNFEERHYRFIDKLRSTNSPKGKTRFYRSFLNMAFLPFLWFLVTNEDSVTSNKNKDESFPITYERLLSESKGEQQPFSVRVLF